MKKLINIFETQKRFQKLISGTECNEQNFKEVYNSATAAIVEIGEMLQTDTRWKPFITKSKKQAIYDSEMFVEEWADAFIYLLNVLIYYNVNITTAINVIENKMKLNKERFDANI